jgi:hypothetical protein
MRKFLIASLLVLAASSANAIPVRYDFTITLDNIQGTQPGSGSSNGSGFVVFDDALAIGGPPGGLVGDMNTPLPTIDLSFDWFGMHFDETNGTLGGLYLDSFGAITGWSIDGLVPPNSCGNSFQCVQWGTTDFSLLAANASVIGGTGTALLTQAGVNGVAVGNVLWIQTPVSSVPEPATLGLMLLGVAGAAFRRRKASRA